MSCDRALPRIRDFLDGELPPNDAAAVAAHVASCAACAVRVAAERDLKLLVRAKFRMEAAPADLRREILRRVWAEVGRPARSTVRAARAWKLAAAAGLLVVAGVSWLLLRDSATPSGMPRTARLAAELVDDHLRFLSAPNPLEFVTTDPAEAGRWFRARLEFPVELPALSADAVALEGARVCRILDRPVALAFYRREGRRLSLFAMLGAGVDHEGVPLVDPTRERCAGMIVRGSLILCWMRGGTVYALVADAAERGIEDLVAAAYRM